MKQFQSDAIPHTCADAKINKLRYVDAVFALEVKNAKYRGAVFSGIIELVNGTDSIRKYKGTDRANVKLAWFGQELKKRNPFVNLANAEITLLPCYTGKVVASLG
jgi:hypothetical protein